MEMESNINQLCNQFAQILKGKGKVENGVCSVSLKRTFDLKIMGKDASSVLKLE